MLEDREEAVFEDYQIQNKYPITDIEQSLMNRNVSITLHWEVVPYFGFLQTMKAHSVVVKLPGNYVQMQQQQQDDYLEE